MILDSTPRGPVLANDQETSDRDRVPATLPCDLHRQPLLAIQRDQGRLNVGHHGLHLDDQDDPSSLVECEDVDRAALPVDAERDLRRDEPAICAQSPDDLLDDGCVVGVQQSIKGLAIPCQPTNDSGAER